MPATVKRFSIRKGGILETRDNQQNQRLEPDVDSPVKMPQQSIQQHSGPSPTIVHRLISQASTRPFWNQLALSVS
jgi:hypothetical protein